MSRATGFCRFRFIICIVLMGSLAFTPIEARTSAKRKSSSKKSVAASTKSTASSTARKKSTASRAATTRRSEPDPPKRRSESEESSFESWAATAARAEATLGESWTVVIEDLDSTETIFEYHSDRKLAPASNRKIITCGMALETLGPDYQFQTEFGLSAPAEPGRAHYHGDVILRSNGDPSLTDPFLKSGRNPAEIFRTWAHALKEAGITNIYGNLVVDASAFGDNQNSYPMEIWGPNHRNQTYAPIPSALAVCQNLMRISVMPGSDGRPGRVNIFPADEGITVINNTRTGGRGRGISINYDETSKALELSGSVSRGGGEVTEIPIPHPLQYVGQLMDNSIKAEGITITGQRIIRTEPLAPGTAPVLAQRLGAHESPPLAQMVYLMMQRSNNFLAEQLWRASAARIKGSADLMKSRQAEIEWYRRHGLTWVEPGWDGSGLSRKNQFSARELAAIARAFYNTAFQSLFLQVLPTAGESGTLRHRSTGTMDGRVTAKTGTLAGASSLTGFIRDEKDHPRFVFSCVGNSAHDTNGRLATRINSLMNIAIRKLDADIAAGRRPTMPTSAPLPGPALQYAFRGSLATGSGDFLGSEAEAMGAERELPTTATANVNAMSTGTTTTIPAPMAMGGATLGQ